jgi:hypothetical protein
MEVTSFPVLDSESKGIGEIAAGALEAMAAKPSTQLGRETAECARLEKVAREGETRE